jgi:hypothetical protein
VLVSGLVSGLVPVLVMGLGLVSVWVSELELVWVSVSGLVPVVVVSGTVEPKAHRSPHPRNAGGETLGAAVRLVVLVLRQAGPREGLCLQSL